MLCCMVVSGLNPEHGKHIFSCITLLDMVPSTRNCGQGFVTQVLHILVSLFKVKFVVSLPVIYLPTQVDTCMSVDTCMYEQSDTWIWCVLKSWSMNEMGTWVCVMKIVQDIKIISTC